jgi:hypothetical protein
LEAASASAALTTPSAGRPEVVGVFSDGTVTRWPRRWLRLEGATLLVGSLLAYSTTHEAWWLVPLTLLVPDVLAVGYLGGSRFGARLYNLAHVTVLLAALIGLGWWRAQPLLLALGLVWLAHIGLDRLLGYGLKYEDASHHTHLGWTGRGLQHGEAGSPHGRPE